MNAKTVAYLLLLPQRKKVFWFPLDKYSIVNNKLRIVVNTVKSWYTLCINKNVVFQSSNFTGDVYFYENWFINMG